MVKKTLILMAVFVICSTALADRQLERSEILDILTVLTQTPTKSWITSGTIEGTCEEYRAPQTTDANEIEINLRIAEEVRAYKDNPNKIQLTEKLQVMRAEAIPFNVRYELLNEYTMSSTVVVKVDGEKFHWQIDVDSRSDSVKPTVDLTGNFMTKEFNLDWNRHRVFAWNGQSYVTYFRPGNHATISSERFPVNGPLTAGIIPWGYGPYTLEELTKAELSGTEAESNGQTEIHLTIQRDGLEETFIFDTAKTYALKQYSALEQEGNVRLYTYGNYEYIGSKWFPKTILIEQYDTTKTPQKLLARDVWDFTSINPTKPAVNAFAVEYEYDAFIEDFTLGGDKPLQYRYSAPELPALGKIDTDELIEKHMEFASASSKQNCATASVKYVCDKLGTNYSPQALSNIVLGPRKSTTLAQMQQFASSVGLVGIAVKTDISTLKKLSNCQIIIHLADQKHFAVLGETDDKFVRLIDLASNNFYCRKSIDWFNSQWNGTALLVAKNPIGLVGNIAMVDDTNLEKITGASDCQDCTKPLQDYHIYGCTQIGCICSGVYQIYYDRDGCDNAPSGSCSESSLLKYKETACGPDGYCDCELDGEWTSYYMQACN